LYAILRSAVKHSLGQFNVAPILDFDRDPNLDTPYDYKNTSANYPTIEVDSNFNPFSDEKPTKSVAFKTSALPSYKKESQPNWESLYVGLKQDTEEVGGFYTENEEVTASLFDEKESEQSVTKTYQIHKKYIVSPIKSGMIIVDQQRAHQRILYEQFLTNMTVQHASSQQLLFPLELFFSQNEMKLLLELLPSLETTGFVFDGFTADSVHISGIPIHTTEGEISRVIDQLIADLSGGIPENSFSQNDTIAKSIAKSLAIKTGTYLTEREQENLVNNLFACKDPNVSPFQKPTFITMRVDDIDKKFKL
jgi:DNA mismatch repair protein MutL